MITISNSKEYYIKEFTQEVYDQIVEQVNFKELTCSCGASRSLVKIGFYPKFFKTPTKKICIQIQRVMCKHCGKTHAIFIECMVPSSMLLISTQIEMLRSYYNHTLEEFLLKYLTIERSNIFYVIKNYEKKWKRYLESAGFSLETEEKKIIRYFLKKYNIQFMQMKYFIKTSSSTLLNHLV